MVAFQMRMVRAPGGGARARPVCDVLRARLGLQHAVSLGALEGMVLAGHVAYPSPRLSAQQHAALFDGKNGAASGATLAALHVSLVHALLDRAKTPPAAYRPQAGEKVNKDLETRMSWVYRRAGLAMLITSLTTCAAFVATAASSPIPTLQNFGIFAAAVIMIDYILVMTFLCSAVVIYHNMFEMKAGLCWCARSPAPALHSVCAGLALALTPSPHLVSSACCTCASATRCRPTRGCSR